MNRLGLRFEKDYWKILLYFTLFPIIPLIYIRFFIFVREETFLFIILSGFIYMIPLFLGLTKTKTYVYCVGTLLAIFSLVEMFYAFVFKGPLSEHIFFVIFDTNIAESGEFFGDFFTPVVVGALALYILAFVLFTLWISKSKEFVVRRNWKVITIFIILPFFIKTIEYKFDFEKVLKTYSKASTPLRFIVSLNEYFEQIKIIEEAHSEDSKPIEGVVKTETVVGKETHVIIIGEATTTNKMSLYGYHRDTNPLLKSVRNELMIYRNVQATAPAVTDVNVPRILTLAENGNPNKSLLRTSILKIMKQAGYTTYWLSNQGSIGHKITIITAIGLSADKKAFTSTANKYNLDDRVFPLFDKYLADKSIEKKFIIIHINGAHNTYSHRYPKEFDKFKTFKDIKKKKFHNKKSLTLINEYDNAILYNDWIVFQIHQKLKKQSGLKSLVYIPDHGEEVFESLNRMGHGGSIPTSGIYKIPLIMWMDDAYKEKTDFVIDEGREYTSDKMIHTFMDLYKVRTPFFDGKKSLFSKDFKPSNLLKFE